MNHLKPLGFSIRRAYTEITPSRFKLNDGPLRAFKKGCVKMPVQLQFTAT